MPQTTQITATRPDGTEVVAYLDPDDDLYTGVDWIVYATRDGAHVAPAAHELTAAQVVAILGDEHADRVWQAEHERREGGSA